ncbi:MAG: phosphatase PAP2 family protein [Myxococcales bacterium]|nr:MAG: phosphatase PAP2 family protein [Myxococcales bacterium]
MTKEPLTGPGRPSFRSTLGPRPTRGAWTLSEPELTYDLRVDLPLTIGGYAIWNVLQTLNRQLAAEQCRWCDEKLNAVDRETRSALRWKSEGHRATAMTLSDIGANVVTPVMTLGLSAVLAARDDRFDRVPVDLVLAYEAISAAGILTQVIKYSAGRLRPDARALPPGERPNTGHGEDAYVSFYSGHTSYVFSLATAAGTIASMRKYPGAGWIWLVGLSTAATTAYLRIAADKHYLTDVLAAAVTSSAIGFAVPYFGHRPVRLPVALSFGVDPAPGGALLRAGAVW